MYKIHEEYLSLLYFQTQILSCHINQRTAGDRGQNAVRLRSYHLAVLRHKQLVGSACLLYLCSGRRVQIHIFVKTVSVGSHDGMKAPGIV